MIYSNISDYINMQTFLVIVPLYTEPKSEAIESGDIIPFFIPEKNAEGYSRVSISGMIDMYSKSIPFTIAKENEIPIIYDHLVMYSNELKKHLQTNKDAAKYYQKLSLFMNQLEKNLNIYVNSNPLLFGKYKANINNLLAKYT